MLDAKKYGFPKQGAQKCPHCGSENQFVGNLVAALGADGIIDPAKFNAGMILPRIIGAW